METNYTEPGVKLVQEKLKESSGHLKIVPSAIVNLETFLVLSTSQTPRHSYLTYLLKSCDIIS